MYELKLDDGRRAHVCLGALEAVVELQQGSFWQVHTGQVSLLVTEAEAARLLAALADEAGDCVDIGQPSGAWPVPHTSSLPLGPAQKSPEATEIRAKTGIELLCKCGIYTWHEKGVTELKCQDCGKALIPPIKVGEQIMVPGRLGAMAVTSTGTWEDPPPLAACTCGANAGACHEYLCLRSLSMAGRPCMNARTSEDGCHEWNWRDMAKLFFCSCGATKYGPER